MKKALLFLVLAAGFNSSAFLFSDEPWAQESWALLGFEYGNFFESYSDKGSTIESYTGSPGINFGGYRFWEGENLGIFIRGLVAFPVVSVTETNGISKKTGISDYVLRFQVGMLIGPGFRYALDERINLKCAVGVGFLLSTDWYTEYIPAYGDAAHSKQSWSLGIGGDLGVKFDITDTVFITAGSVFTYDFAGHIDMETPYGSSSGWAKDYYMFGIRPYIAAGINLYWK